VEDAVRAVLALVDTDSTIGDYFNVGGIGETTIKQLAEKAIEVTKSSSQIKFIPYEEVYPAGFEDMQRRVPDISKINRSIGWEPRHDLDSIIKSVLRAIEVK
jgi:UDP-glucose 4-epimerase